MLLIHSLLRINEEVMADRCNKIRVYKIRHKVLMEITQEYNYHQWVMVFSNYHIITVRMIKWM
jgi:hypothetical protein